MALPKIIVLGAGLGGTIAAYEIMAAVRGRATVTLVSQSEDYWFIPSNPWVAIRWRDPEAIRVHLPEPMRRRGITFIATAARRVHPMENRLELEDGTSLSYDWLVVATGAELAFDEIPGFGPQHHTVSICETGHASAAALRFDQLLRNPGPAIVGATQGASCFGPAYEFVMLLDTELRKRKVRDRVPLTFVTPEPYIGHMGVDGIGDTRGLLEHELRDRDIRWVTSAKVQSVDADTLHIAEIGDDGAPKGTRDLPFRFAMLIPPFRGVPALTGVEGLVNPRGFVLVDRHQRNPTHRNIFALGVCIAIPPTGPTPVPVGVPKTGFMIESMVEAIARNLADLIAGREPVAEASWSAVCLADFGDGGVAFVAQPQIPPRNVNWSAEGKWVHTAKIAFERYFLGRVRKGQTQPFYEKFILDRLGIRKLR